MGRILRTALPAVLLIFALAACSRGAKVIPVRKMERIYREMFLADQWLADNPDKQQKADTTWFYEPIFEKYGFTLKDYQKSVDYYLNDPKRYAEMLGRVYDGLCAECDAVNRRIALEDKARFEADSIARARKSLPWREFRSFTYIFKGSFPMDTVCFLKDSLGVYSLVPVVKDTMFSGPELVIRDTVATSADSASAAVPARLVNMPRNSAVPVPPKRLKNLELLPAEEIIDEGRSPATFKREN